MAMVELILKDIQVFRNAFIHPWHPKLVDVYAWIYERFEKVVITETWRAARHPGDVHSTDPLRAFDIRSWIYKDPKYNEEEINRNWVYDNERPGKNVALLHDSGNGMHFHIQVHDNTHLV